MLYPKLYQNDFSFFDLSLLEVDIEKSDYHRFFHLGKQPIDHMDYFYDLFIFQLSSRYKYSFRSIIHISPLLIMF